LGKEFERNKTHNDKKAIKERIKKGEKVRIRRSTSEMGINAWRRISRVNSQVQNCLKEVS
jgi:hypothetical protein